MVGNKRRCNSITVTLTCTKTKAAVFGTEGEREIERKRETFLHVCIYRFTKPYNKRFGLKHFLLLLHWLGVLCVFFIVSFAVSISIFWFRRFFYCIFLLFGFFLRAFTGYNKQNVVLRFSVVETRLSRIDCLPLHLLSKTPNRRLIEQKEKEHIVRNEIVNV